MALIEYAPLVQEVRGASSPGEIHRHKHYRDAKGRIIGAAHPEHYNIKNPRNWKQKPAHADELSNQKSWGKSCYLTEALLNSDEGYTYLQQRFTNQLYATRGSHADALASVDTATHSRKRYMRFDAYCRAIIRNLLKLVKCNSPQEALQALRQHE